MLAALVAVVCPVIELVGSSDLFHVGVQRIGAAECGSLSGMDCVGLAVTGGLAVAFANRDNGIASIFTGFQAIISRLRNGEGQVWSVDLENIVAVQLPHPDIDRTRT